MIQIAFQVSFQDQTSSLKKIEFDNIHERNLTFLYENIKFMIDKNRSVTTDQLLIVCTYHIVNACRKNPDRDIIGSDLLQGAPAECFHAFLDNKIKEISADIKIDNIPKKRVSIKPKQAHELA